VADARFEALPGEFVSLGISVGCAIYPDDGTTYEALLKTADSRMYRDKSSRRAPVPGPNALRVDRRARTH